MPHPAERLNHRISFESETLTSDGAGGYTTAWEEAGVAWAAISPYSRYSTTAEGVFAEKLQTRQFFRFTLRYRAGITPAMRIAYDGRVFNIRTISNPEEKGQWLEIIATEGE